MSDLGKASHAHMPGQLSSTPCPSLPLQPVVIRQKDKVVLLPGDSDLEGSQQRLSDTAEESLAVPSIFEDLEEEATQETRGRVTVYCIAGGDSA